MISADDGAECREMTANAFMSGSLEPPLIIVSIGRRARMHRILEVADVFGVTVLAREQQGHSRWFAGQAGGRGQLVRVFARLLYAPVLGGGNASLAARIVHRYPCGDHTLFVGAVEALEVDEGGRPPLLFYAGRYAHVDPGDLSGMREAIPAPPFLY